MITCDKPTTHYGSGKELLQAWDQNKDGIISKDDIQNMLLTELQSLWLTQDERKFVCDCYKNYDGDINKMCPDPIPVPIPIPTHVPPLVILFILMLFVIIVIRGR